MSCRGVCIVKKFQTKKHARARSSEKTIEYLDHEVLAFSLFSPPTSNSSRYLHVRPARRYAPTAHRLAWRFTHRFFASLSTCSPSTNPNAQRPAALHRPHLCCILSSACPPTEHYTTSPWQPRRRPRPRSPPRRPRPRRRSPRRSRPPRSPPRRRVRLSPATNSSHPSAHLRRPSRSTTPALTAGPALRAATKKKATKKKAAPKKKGARPPLGCLAAHIPARATVFFSAGAVS